MKFRRLIPRVSLALFSALIVSCDGTSWPVVDAKIRHDFPQVKRITTAELASWLQDPKRTPPVLLDVRTAAEYEVSRLRDARRIQPGSPASALQLPKDQPIVTYCSRRNDSETDIAFSRAQNGPAPKLSLRLGRFPAPENKTGIARFWISDSR